MPIPLILGGLSLLGGFIGLGMQASAQSDAAERQAEIDRKNAILAEKEAKDVIVAGQVLQGKIDMMAAAKTGMARVAAASNGIVVGQGSAGRAEIDTAMMAAVDKKTVANNAARAAFGLRTQGLQYRRQAADDLARGADLSTGTILSGVGSLASQGVQLYNKAFPATAPATTPDWVT